MLQDTPIRELGLSSRAYQVLDRAGVKTVAQLITLSEDELLGVRNFGLRSLQELHQQLVQRGMRPPAWWEEVLNWRPPAP